MSHRTGVSGILAAARVHASRAGRAWFPYVLGAATVYVVSAILGFAVGTGNGDATMLPIADGAAEFTAPGAASLFVHNAIVALQVVAGTIFGGLPSLYLLGYNGFVLGHVVSSAVTDFGALTTLVLLLPHGVFELPAIWLAGAITFRWVHVGARVATATARTQPAAITFIETLVVLALTTVLLGVAAVVEASITPELATLARTVTSATAGQVAP